MKEAVPVLKSFSVGNEAVDLDYLLNSPFEDIGEAVEKIPSAIGWLGYHKGLAIERIINAEQNWKVVEAKEYFELKNGAFTARGYGDKATEEALKKAVLLTESVKGACTEYAKHKRHLEWISSSIEALKCKLELVRSNEATRRMEHEPDRNKGTTE